jgi:acyl-CoA synthetase (AMP-forming)/AMP-acid ligase II
MEDVAASVLSRLPDHGHGTAFVDAATGGSLSFPALRRGALSLAAGLRLGLGLRRGDAVLVLSRNSLLLPQILLGVLAAGGVVVAADPDAATAAEVAAAAHGSGAVMIIAEPDAAEVAAAAGAGVGVPLLLTSRSSSSPLSPSLSAEELIEGGDPTAADLSQLSSAEEEVVMSPSPSPSAAAASRTTVVVADLVAAVQVPHEAGEGRRVCLASLPMCSAHGLALVALGLPAAGVTTVLPHPAAATSGSSLWEAVATHAATDVVAAPEALAGGGRPMPLDASSKLTSLRRVMVATAPLTPEARRQLRRRLPWVNFMEVAAGIPCNDQQMSATEVAASTVETPFRPVSFQLTCRFDSSSFTMNLFINITKTGQLENKVK